MERALVVRDLLLLLGLDEAGAGAV